MGCFWRDTFLKSASKGTFTLWFRLILAIGSERDGRKTVSISTECQSPSKASKALSKEPSSFSQSHPDVKLSHLVDAISFFHWIKGLMSVQNKNFWPLIECLTYCWLWYTVSLFPWRSAEVVKLQLSLSRRSCHAQNVFILCPIHPPNAHREHRSPRPHGICLCLVGTLDFDHDTRSILISLARLGSCHFVIYFYSATVAVRNIYWGLLAESWADFSLWSLVGSWLSPCYIAPLSHSSKEWRCSTKDLVSLIELHAPRVGSIPSVLLKHNLFTLVFVYLEASHNIWRIKLKI